MKRTDGALYTRKKEQGRHGICLADADNNAGDGDGGAVSPATPTG